MMHITLHGEPRSKKNSQRLIHAGARIVPIASKAYTDYRNDCLKQILGHQRKGIEGAVNIKCVYYMGTHRKVDLVNLLEATCDILTDAGVIADDNSRIVAGHDGSRVLYDKDRPRVEIEIDWLGGTEK